MTELYTNDEWQNLFLGKTPPEELDPELEAYTADLGGIGKSVRHPLVYSVPHFEQLNAFVNAQLRQKKDYLATALKEEDWPMYLLLYQRPYRPTAFREIADQVDDFDYWDYVEDLWTDSENIYQDYDLWLELLTADRLGHEHMMSDVERKFLSELPDEFTVYRGSSENGRAYGLSWTLDRAKAKWFARRDSRTGDFKRLARGRVRRDDVIAYLNGRNENEIVVLPENVRNKRKERIQ